MDDLGQLVTGLESFIRNYGAPAAFPILAIEALGAPVPGETLLIFASVLCAHGEMSLPALLIFAWAGSVLGDNIGYMIGRKVGRPAILHYGGKVGLTDARIDAVQRVFLRFGSATVMFARFFNILRQLNGIVAGTLGMSWRRFLLFNALGGVLWVTVWVLAATYFTEHLAILTTLAHHTKVVAIILVVAILIFAIACLARRLRGAAGLRR